MDLAIKEQIYVFMICVYGGIALGLIFDIYRILRKIFRIGKKLTYVGDIIFGLLSGVLIFCIVFFTNYAELRFYVFLGFLLGIFIYMELFSYLFLKISFKTIKFVRQAALRVYRIFLFPVKAIYKFIKKVLHRKKS